MSALPSEPTPTAPRANILIVATSLNPASRSRLLARRALSVARERYPETVADLIDLNELGPIPFAGQPEGWQPHPALDQVRSRMREATHVLLAVPIYNFNTGAAVKNLVELMGEAELGGKTVGFLCSAGGPRGYMSVLPLANTLMLDFRCWIVPRFVYATRGDFTDGQVTGEDVLLRIDQLVNELFGPPIVIPA